jgi:hypothetical protein
MTNFVNDMGMESKFNTTAEQIVEMGRNMLMSIQVNVPHKFVRYGFEFYNDNPKNKKIECCLEFMISIVKDYTMEYVFSNAMAFIAKQRMNPTIDDTNKLFTFTTNEGNVIILRNIPLGSLEFIDLPNLGLVEPEKALILKID